MLEGSLAVHVQHAGEGLKVILQAGEVCGEMALFNGGHRNAQVLMILI